MKVRQARTVRTEAKRLPSRREACTVSASTRAVRDSVAAYGGRPRQRLLGPGQMRQLEERGVGLTEVQREDLARRDSVCRSAFALFVSLVRQAPLGNWRRHLKISAFGANHSLRRSRVPETPSVPSTPKRTKVARPEFEATFATLKDMLLKQAPKRSSSGTCPAISRSPRQRSLTASGNR